MSGTRKRSRRTAKDNGTRWESAMEAYLQWALDDLRIRRLRLNADRDIGDIGVVYYRGEPVTIECKWTDTLDAGPHMREAEREAGNWDSPYPWVLQKRDRVGLTGIHRLGQHMAYTRTSVLDAMLLDWDETMRRRILTGSSTIGRRHDITMISTRQFALLLNHGEPLGPDQ